MSKKVLNYAGKRPMLLAILVMATLTLGLLFSGWLTPTPGKAQNGSQNPQPNAENCDNPTTTTNCAASAQLVLKNVTISPAAPTNAPYDCIVCVCDSVSAHLQWFTIPSTNVTQTCHTCKGSTPTNYCDAPIYTAGASPYNITNEWWNEWWYDWTNGIGDSVSFSFTNATTGEIWFDNISAMMTTNAPGCGVSVYWATNAVSCRSYAFVAVDSISPNQGQWVTNIPCDTYFVEYDPSNTFPIIITASPNPGMDDKFLPAGWNMSGGLTYTNADGTISRTMRQVKTSAVGSTTVTATSGCSSKSVKIIVYESKFILKVMRGHFYVTIGWPPFDISFGHSWWELTLQPAEAKSLFYKLHPDLYKYIDEAGFWPDNWNPIPGWNTVGPGNLQIGAQEPTVNSQRGWDIPYDWLVYETSQVKSFDTTKPEPHFDLYNYNCTVVAIAFAEPSFSAFAFLGNYIPAYTYPGDLADFIDNLNSTFP
jgi:hypothetical protein